MTLTTPPLSRRALVKAGVSGLLLSPIAEVAAEGRGIAKPKVATARHTLTVGAPVPTAWMRNDTNAGIDQDADGLTWMIIGTNDWAIYSGRSLDTMTLHHTVRPLFPRPHGDDLYWASGLWIDPADGVWYCPVHCEYNYGRYTNTPTKDGWSIDHRRRMLLATSSNKGKSWSLIGDILTGYRPEEPATYPGDYYDKGVGDAQIYIDDAYFWAFYRTGWFRKSDQKFFEVIRVARSAKHDKMRPGTWHKWFDGYWNEPGLGGRDSDVFNAGSADTAYVFYSTLLHQHVALIGAADIDNPQGYLATCADLTTQNWTTPIRFADADVHRWYNWAVDPATMSRHVIGGGTFRYFTSRYEPPVAQDARFVPAPASPVTTPPLYPPVAVADPNPAWNRSGKADKRAR